MPDPSTAGPVNGHSDLVPQGSVGSVKCSAHTSSGRPCKRWAIVGGTVCPTHGGSAPQVREAARRRITDMVLSNLSTAQRLIDDPETPAPVRARLLIDMLDRAGLRPADVLISARADDATDAPDLDAGIREALALRGLLPGGGDQGGGEDVVDAVVVDDDDEPAA